MNPNQSSYLDIIEAKLDVHCETESVTRDCP
jgi:hypothetical protein